MNFHRKNAGIGSGQLKKAIARNRRKQMQKRATFSNTTGIEEEEDFYTDEGPSRPERPASGREFTSEQRMPRTTRREGRPDSLSTAPPSPPFGLRRATMGRGASGSFRSPHASAPLADKLRNTDHHLRSRSRLTSSESSTRSAGHYAGRTTLGATASALTTAASGELSRDIPLIPEARPQGTKWYHKILICGGWVFCCVLLGRLIFAGGGVLNYYSQERLIQRKIYQNQLVKKENVQLLQEITMIDEDPVHQRKLVRKHLGVIAKDEYLILFAREKAPL